MNHPDDLMYTSEHEWVKIENNIATVGITDFAQGELGDIIFLEFPDIDESVLTFGRSTLYTGLLPKYKPFVELQKFLGKD